MRMNEDLGRSKNRKAIIIVSCMVSVFCCGLVIGYLFGGAERSILLQQINILEEMIKLLKEMVPSFGGMRIGFM